LLTSSDKKRPPIFKRTIIIPIKYGFELILATNASMGFIDTTAGKEDITEPGRLIYYNELLQKDIIN
jgi:hypothetical protein